MSELRKVTCKTCGKIANYADEYGPAFAESQCECVSETEPKRAAGMSEPQIVDEIEAMKANAERDWRDLHHWSAGILDEKWRSLDMLTSQAQIALALRVWIKAAVYYQTKGEVVIDG